MLRLGFLLVVSLSFFSCEEEILENRSAKLLGSWSFDWVRDCARVTCADISDQYENDRLSFFEDNQVEWSYDGKVASGSWELHYIDGSEDSELVLVMGFVQAGSTNVDIRIWENFQVNDNRIRSQEDVNNGAFRYRLERE